MENRIKSSKNKIIFALILLLSGVLNFYNLKLEGFANKYYAAGVRSMGLNIRNSFFVSIVGSSTNNSVMELILGHNGLERVGVNINHPKSLLNVFKTVKTSTMCIIVR